MTRIFIGLWLLLGVVLFSTPGVSPLFAQTESATTAAATSSVAAPATPDAEPVVYLLGRDDCGFCKKEFAYLEEAGIDYEYLNITEDDRAAELFDAITQKHDISKVTPITVIGPHVIVGFNGAETTGAQIQEAIASAQESDIRTIEEHL